MRKCFVIFTLLSSCRQTQNVPISKIVQLQGGSLSRMQLLRSIADSLYNEEMYAKAINYYDTLIKLDSGNGEFYFKRGYSYDMVYKRQELKTAIDDYLKSAELGYRVSKSYRNLGLLYMYKNDSMAIVFFQKSLKEDPDNAETKLFLENCKSRFSK